MWLLGLVLVRVRCVTKILSFQIADFRLELQYDDLLLVVDNYEEVKLKTIDTSKATTWGIAAYQLKLSYQLRS